MGSYSSAISAQIKLLSYFLYLKALNEIWCIPTIVFSFIQFVMFQSNRRSIKLLCTSLEFFRFRFHEKTTVVYCLPKVFGNFAWNVNSKAILVFPTGQFPKFSERLER